MTKFKNKYRVESNRYKYWDYSLPGLYFITICTQKRECFFGHIADGTMILSDYGRIVKTEIEKIPHYHEYVRLDKWVIMPNHLHFIIEIEDVNHVEKIMMLMKLVVV